MIIGKLNALNVYLGEQRKYLLLILNLVLFIFVLLELIILSNIKPDFEIQTAGTEYCRTCGDKKGNFSQGW